MSARVDTAWLGHCAPVVGHDAWDATGDVDGAILGIVRTV